MEDQNVVLCINCGGAYRQGELLCPYCQAENVTEAKVRKQKKLAAYDTEAQEMEKNLVGKIVKIVTRILLILAAVLIVGFLVAAAVAALSGPLTARAEQQKRQKHIAEMEILLEQKDYASLLAYVTEHSIGGEVCYDKYTQVTDLYNSLEYMYQWKEQLYQDRTFMTSAERLEDQEYWCEAVIGEAMYYMPETRTYLNDRVVLGNEVYLEELYQQIMDELRATKLTEDELRELTRERSWEDWDRLKESYGKLMQQRLFDEVRTVTDETEE